MGIIYHEGKLYNSSSVIADNVVSEQTTFSSDKILNSIAGLISDSAISATTVWSSQKANSVITNLGNKTVVNGTIEVVNSWTQVQTALTTKVSSMQNNTIENMIIACSATFTQMPNGGYFATQVFKTNNNMWSALLQGYSGEIKHISYNSNTWKFFDLTSMLTWKSLGNLEPTTASQSKTYTISDTIHEFLVAYGRKNSTQPYGGGTVVLPNNVAQEHIPCMPVYQSNSTALYGVVTFFVYSKNTISYSASGTGMLLKVYYR